MSKLIEAMQQPGFYDHQVNQVDKLETHASWILLAGDFAYKIKKPVNFGFLDYSTLSKRRHCCQKELELNRRFAPQLYLTVVAIGGSLNNPILHALPAQEYAVKMLRFPQTAQLDRMLMDNQLNSSLIEKFACHVAQIHQTAPIVSTTTIFGSAAAVFSPVAENFKQLKTLPAGVESLQLSRLESWSNTAWQQLNPVFQQRKSSGFIRECHGDLHLANMAWVDKQPLLFDGIEFNENLRCIDVISDIAFLAMDLDDRGHPELGWGFINCYLQQTADYAGLQLLDFYRVYRAMVRAKVICLRLAQTEIKKAEYQQDLRRYQSYLDLAERYTNPRQKHLILTHGLSGSGKTTFARQLAPHLGALHLQSDRERKRLFDLPAQANSGSPLDDGIYSPQAHADTYQQLAQQAKTILTAGFSVIIDATCLQTAQRELFLQLARQQKVPLTLLDFPLPETELRRRILQRQVAGTDISEANLKVFELQLRQQQPLTATEQSYTLTIDPDTPSARIAEQLMRAEIP